MSLPLKLYVIAGILLLPVGLLWALDGRGSRPMAPVAESPRAHRHHAQWQRVMMYRESFDVGSGTLVIDVEDADVEIRSGDARTVVVEGWVSARDASWGREVFRRAEFRATRRDNVVRVLAADPRIRSDEWERNRGAGIVAVVTVPAAFNLRVTTSDGDVDIGSIRGDVNVHTSDGNITINEVIGGRVILETSDGDIVVASLTGSDVRLVTSDGNIELESVRGPTRATTSDGNIIVWLQEQNGGLTVETGDGDITIYAPRELQADVLLEGENIEVGRDLSLQGSMGSRMIRGTLNGGGARISARTGDGEITLRRSR